MADKFSPHISYTAFESSYPLPSLPPSLPGSVSLGAGSISEFAVAHVLDDDITVAVLIGTRMLVGPLNGQDGAFVVVEVPHVVASTVVVLGIKQPTEGKNIYITVTEYMLAKSIYTTWGLNISNSNAIYLLALFLSLLASSSLLLLPLMKRRRTFQMKKL